MPSLDEWLKGEASDDRTDEERETISAIRDWFIEIERIASEMKDDLEAPAGDEGKEVELEDTNAQQKYTEIREVMAAIANELPDSELE